MRSRMRAVERWLRTSAKPSRLGIPTARHAAASRTALVTHQPRPASRVALARSVYRLNDRRAALKRAVSQALGSALVEEKSYTAY